MGLRRRLQLLARLAGALVLLAGSTALLLYVESDLFFGSRPSYGASSSASSTVHHAYVAPHRPDAPALQPERFLYSLLGTNPGFFAKLCSHIAADLIAVSLILLVTARLIPLLRELLQPFRARIANKKRLLAANAEHEEDQSSLGAAAAL
ncbi:hypothetical protein FHS18_006638 [Paenibacillus phyllosphaerae]|uniref:Uncharacterized protein n=1 Tax=Paenibacillus phyllosphaerae TaxID=274593 RepID=A0A7W5B506_9BACL|nr:hypothetical protein [Paenibacillus phyllosphaerae]MBB3114517.1 hypothetical protein [Paenibacillus phyllosphaerae]